MIATAQLWPTTTCGSEGVVLDAFKMLQNFGEHFVARGILTVGDLLTFWA